MKLSLRHSASASIGSFLLGVACQHSAAECIASTGHVDHFDVYGRDLNPFSGTSDMADHALCSALDGNQGHTRSKHPQPVQAVERRRIRKHRKNILMARQKQIDFAQ